MPAGASGDGFLARLQPCSYTRFGHVNKERAEILRVQISSGKAKHVLSGRVDLLNAAIFCMQGNNAIRHRVQNGLNQRCAIAEFLQHRMVFRYIPKHQHRTNHLRIAVQNWRAAISNIALDAIARNQQGMVRQALDGAVRQGV